MDHRTPAQNSLVHPVVLMPFLLNVCKVCVIKKKKKKSKMKWHA